jgi:hypothetical protein
MIFQRFKRKVNKELEEKNRLLRENPGLLQLYKDLVQDYAKISQFEENKADVFL